MYLMNVPPFAATHTEWRTCGPPPDFSLHGLHSSDSELSTGDANIQDKVQMIIKSLRSTQSSIDMGDEIVGNVPQGQEVHLEACKFGMGPLVGAKSSTGSGTESRQTQSVFPVKSESQDSDSDDSVDRGIEEAILEYLKEKDGHKRNEEPSSNILLPSKVHRKTPPVPEICKQHSDSNIVLSANHQFSKITEVETPMAPVQSSVTKNYSIHPTPFKEIPVKKMEKSMTTKSVLSKEPKKVMENNFDKKAKDPVPVKTERDSLDSSSDDGIEEAIQKYQLEKKDKEIGSKEACNSFTSQDLTDSSSSDDGIEEAIRSYQREQLKEKNVPKPLLLKQRPSIKSPLQSPCSSNTEKINKLKSKKKSKNKNVQSGPPLSSVLLPKSSLFGSSNSNGNGALLLKEEPFKIHSPTTTKTTPAELMCAEAILDISKAVMPAAFTTTVSIDGFNTNETLSGPSTTAGGSSDSSIDSEDGIEQEICMFLEQKAQMQKQPQTTATLSSLPASLNEPDMVKGKTESIQKKVLRLSLTQRRKLKSLDCKKPATSPKRMNELALKDGEGSSSLVSYQMELSPSSVEFDKTERGGDKSSSLDSDEDLDTAIKDLLKTKRKLKRKTRDLKLKSRKCLKDPEPCDGIPTKKQKPNPVSKRVVLKKAPIKNRDISEKTKVSRKSPSQQKQTIKRIDDGGAGEIDQLKGTGSGNVLSLYTSQSAVQGSEDNSSVDSDDSIEQEIRKFLAEKAKVTPTETRNKDEDRPIYGSISKQLTEKATKLESQLAEIPTPENTRLPDVQGKLCEDGLSSMSPLTIGTTCHPSLLSRSPSLLQHTDGVVKREELRPSIGCGHASSYSHLEKARARLATSPSVVQPFSDAMKWRQSLGLPIKNTRPVFASQPSSNITSSSMNETGAAAATPFHRARINPKPHTPVTLWTSARNSQPVLPIRHYPETPVNPMSSSVPNPFFATKHSLGRSPMMGLSTGKQSQAERESRLAPPSEQDQGALTRLDPTRRSGQVWVQASPMSEGRAEKLTSRGNEGREEFASAEKAVQSVKTEVEDFVDETDCELDERPDAEKTRGVSSM